MEEKYCCGILDFDGVLVPGEELMDVYVWDICKEASNAYCDELFKEQTDLIKIQQRLEEERDIFGPEMDMVRSKLEELNRRIKQHFDYKDQVLEETEEKYKNRIPYKEIYKKENIYPGVLELLWRLYENGVFHQLIVNTHVNAEAEIIAKKELLKKDFPPIKFIPVRYHIEPYRFNGVVNRDRKPSDKIGRLLSFTSYIDPKRSIFVDNTKSIINRGKELGLNCYFVEKNLDPFITEFPTLNPIPCQVILQAANDTIEKEHAGKIKKLSL